jgi:putative peptidoglycan lipid II flippase
VVEGNFSLYLRRFFSGTLLSRFSGLARDLAMAFCFGDHPSVAAFMVAFRLSNLLRRLLGEGPFQSAFIPYFEELRAKNEEEAFMFFRKLTGFILMLLLIATVIAEIVIIGVLYGFNVSADNREILVLTAWMFPGIIFICLYGLNLSLLNCYDSFFIPSFAPAICNTVWIVVVLFLKHQNPSMAMLTLAKWVTFGLFCQWLFTMPATLKHISSYFKEWMRWALSKDIVGIAKGFSMGIIGVSAMQINGFVDTIFARYADIRGPTYLWYSIRLEQLVLAIFGIACVSIVVPRLSRAIKMKNFTYAQELFAFSYKRVMAIMIPSTMAIVALGFSVVDLFYGRGHFSFDAVFKTTMCLWAYGLGLVPTTLVILFSAIFYANNNFKLPTIISVFTMLINILLNALFVMGLNFGTVSTALATSISAWINCFVLYQAVLKEGVFRANFPMMETLKLVFVSVFAFTIFLGYYLLFNDFFFTLTTFVGKAMVFSLQFLLFVGELFCLSLLMKIDGFLEVFYSFLPIKKRSYDAESK